MQIVIKINEKDYHSLKDGHIPFNVLDVIMNGTILPKGHGDLIDRKVLMNTPYEKGGFVEWYDEIKYAPTIIEAESEVKV